MFLFEEQSVHDLFASRVKSLSLRQGPSIHQSPPDTHFTHTHTLLLVFVYCYKRERDRISANYKKFYSRYFYVLLPKVTKSTNTAMNKTILQK